MKTAKEIKEITLLSRLDNNEIGIINEIQTEITNQAMQGKTKCLGRIRYSKDFVIELDCIKEYIENKGYEVESIISYGINSDYHLEYLDFAISWEDA